MLLLKFESSRDLLYTDIAEIDVIADQHIQWKGFQVDLLQTKIPRLFNILSLKKTNIQQDASNIQMTNYLSDVQENFKYKFTLKIVDSKEVLRKIVYHVKIRKPRSENGKCHFVDNIYLKAYETYAFKIGIKVKVCLMRYTTFSENSIEAIKMKGFFQTYAGAIQMDHCRKNHFKYSPQLRKFLCLCQYNERPCETFIGCVAYGKVCSNRGFCVISEPFSLCSCIENFGSYHCEKLLTPCEMAPQCKNDGKCINIGNLSWSCKCPHGFKGNRCELRDLCQNYLCYNQGTCHIEKEKPKCRCLEGYTGHYCELELSKCPKCQNKGKCFSPNLGYNYICQCPNGYVGRLCEFQRKKCKGEKVCYNFGKCYQNRWGEENCFCQDKYYGELCEKHTDCPIGYFGPHCRSLHACYKRPKLCMNSGHCTIANEHLYLCQCKTGYHGDKCQHRHCIRDSECFNRGTCEINGSHGTCICSTHYTGKFCQYFNECFGNSKCNYNGQCIRKSKGKFQKCVCNFGWEGTFCDSKTKLNKSEL